MSIINGVNLNSKRASELVKRKLYENDGAVTIPLLDGKYCKIVVGKDGLSFTSDKLNKYKVRYEYSVFDDIVELLMGSQNYKAPKGNAHGKEDKVGYGKCTADTVVGAIAIKYAKRNLGDSAFDPVFVMAAVLDWAGIAKNCRGYIQLTPAYLELIAK